MTEGTQVLVAGGLESISCVQNEANTHMRADPWILEHKPTLYWSMLQTAETVAKRYHISKQAQDEYGVRSQLRAAAAQAAGKFKDEIVPMTTTMGVVDKATGAIITRETTIDADEDQLRCDRPVHELRVRRCQGGLRERCHLPSPRSLRAEPRGRRSADAWQRLEHGSNAIHAPLRGRFDPRQQGLRIDPDEQDRGHDRADDQVLAELEVRERGPPSTRRGGRVHARPPRRGAGRVGRARPAAATRSGGGPAGPEARRRRRRPLQRAMARRPDELPRRRYPRRPRSPR